MRKPIIDQDIFLDVNKRIIKRLWKVNSPYFPEGLEFTFQFLFFKNNKWIQVTRIDNQLHEGKIGTHIHTLKREKVEWENLTFREAEKKIIKIGEKVIKNI
ncbi:hypothetical protein ACFL1H_05395, partial [Nanoarchaeota archaeon]